METELHLQLLGGLQARRGGAVMHFVTSKAAALLCYLAVTGRPHFRTALAGLLWGEHSEEDARCNLRVVLTHLRQLVAPHLLITRETIAFDRASAYWLDVEQFEAALQDGTLRDVDRLHAAVELYRGDFLEGFYVRDAPEFDEWATAQRERLRQLVLHALHELVSYHTAQQEYAAAVNYCTRLLQFDPWREDAHRQLMLLLAQSGQRDAALIQYETCCRILLDELGVEPDVETTALYERIRLRQAGHNARPRETDGMVDWLAVTDHDQTPRHNLPSYYTSFVGREAELAQITARLTDPTCRLLTLVGPGGVGKTRLAVCAAARRLDVFADGVYFVPLASVSVPQHIIPAIVSALGLAYAGHDDPMVQLQRYLREKTLLLVLDNVEQLLQGAVLLLDILAAAPSVKLLLTSRERLAVQAEHLLHVHGLSYPEHTTGGDIADYDAVQLFVRRACQARADFALSGENAASVVRICQLVGGTPLAIELAATWVRLYTCQEIAEEIANSLDFLATSLRDVAERHRSIRVVFDHSWNLLTAKERAILQQLAIFHGGFRTEAAQVVAGASLVDLVSLLDKSLLRRIPSGRYGMHPLVSQYAEERLTELPEEDAAARERHCAFFAAFLEGQERALKGEGQHAALDIIEGEIHNLRVAWQWAVMYSRVMVIGRMLESLCLFYELRGWLQEGDSATAQAVERLTDLSDLRDGAAAVVRARLLAWRGRFCHVLGYYDESERLIAQSLALAHKHDARHMLAFCLNTQGCNAGVRGDYGTARRLFKESLMIYRAVGDQFGVAELLNYLGGVAYDQGDFGETRRCWEEACAVSRASGDRSGLARLLNNLGEVSRFLGEYAQARQQSEESLALLRDIGHGWQLAGTLYNLGAVAQCEGRYAEARQLLEESLAIGRQIGRPRSVGLALLDLAIVALCEGALDEAQTLADEALELYQRIGHRRGISYSLTTLAQLAIRRNDDVGAKRLAEASLHIAREIGDKMAIGAALRSLGRAKRGLGASAVAERMFGDALRLFVDIRAFPEALETLVEQAELLLYQPAVAITSAQTVETTAPEERAAQLLAFVLHHPASWRQTCVRAEQLQAELERLLPPEACTAAHTRGRKLSLAELVVASVA